MKRVYWYKIVDGFNTFSGSDKIFELRSMQDGSVVIVLRCDLGEYAEEIGLEYMGYEEVEEGTFYYED